MKTPSNKQPYTIVEFTFHMDHAKIDRTSLKAVPVQPRDMGKVEKAGGPVFYYENEAWKACGKFCTPKKPSSMMPDPKANGTFSDLKIAGCRIYKPNEANI